MDNQLKYDIKDKPKKWYEWILYPLQMILAVFVATVLIANICGTPISSCLLGACVGTIVYQVITRFKSPMFISSCGATVSAVCGALAMNETGNYLMVLIGGIIILIIYVIFALIIKFKGINLINKIFPPYIVGAITIVIGLNLAKFLVGYTNLSGLDGNSPINIQIDYLIQPYVICSMVVAIVTMLITAVVSHYGKGFMKNIPFLFGLAGGYVLAIIISLCGVTIPTTDGPIPFIDFSVFKGINVIGLPDFAFLHITSDQWSWTNFGQTILFFVPVAICALLEHYSDHKVLSNIIGKDLIKDPGMDKTLIGDGVASALGTAICGLPNTSYGESIATIGFSRVASVLMTTIAAAALGVLAFFPPIAALINSIPSCVFGGCAMILYGYIAASGLKTIINNKVDLENNKMLIVVSVILTVGVSGIAFIVPAFAGVSLAMVLGVILNLILVERKPKQIN